MAKMAVFFHLPGWKTVGYAETYGSGGGDMPFEHDFAPFGDMPGYEEWGSAWWQSYADSLDEAVARLKDWMQVIGLRGEPIVAEDIPTGKNEAAGAWDEDHARAVVLDEMMNCGIAVADIFRGCGEEDDDEFEKWLGGDVVRGGWKADDWDVLAVRLRRGCPFPLLPSTTEAEIRQEVRRWAYDLKTAWAMEENGTADEEDAAYARRMQEYLSTTYSIRKEKKKKKNLISTTEAAEIIGILPRSVKTLCQRGKLPGARKAGRDWLIPRASAEGYEKGPQGFAAHPELAKRKKKDK